MYCKNTNIGASYQSEIKLSHSCNRCDPEAFQLIAEHQKKMWLEGASVKDIG
jgi:hypothetical protein